jgi:DNA-binding GntR family transcriptional regulator
MNSFASAQYNRDTPTALPFSRVRGQKLSAEDLYSQIFDAIHVQRIDSASRFTEDSLGQMFGAGRSEIRRVLVRLYHEQVVILRPNHRPRIAAPTCEQTRQVLHARRLAETTLVQLAGQHHRPGDLNTLRDLIDEQRKYQDRGQRGPAIRLSGEFHLQLASMAGNNPLANFIGSLVPLTSLAIARFATNIEGYCCWRRQAAIVDALEQTEIATAVRLINQHLDEIEQSLVSTQQ